MYISKIFKSKNVILTYFSNSLRKKVKHYQNTFTL